MNELAVILGLSGPKLTAGERVFFRDANPWGFILFSRNVENPEQLLRLTSELRETVGRNCLIFVDQEGGRVQRLRAPHWRKFHPVLRFNTFIQKKNGWGNAPLICLTASSQMIFAKSGLQPIAHLY